MERKRLYIIGGIVLGLMALILLIQLLLPKSGSLTIVAPSNSPINVNVTSNDGDYTKTFLVDAGAKQELRLSVGSYKVDSSLGSYRSMDIIAMKEGENKTLKVSFAAASSSIKLSEALDNCPLVVNNAVYDYDCMNGGFVYKLDGQGTKEILFDSQFFDYMVAYRDGFLGVPQDGSVNYINVATGTMQPIYLPQDISSSEDIAKTFITTSSDPTKNYFALSLDEADAIYLYKSADDQNPRKLKLPKKEMLSRKGYMSSLSFRDDKLVVFAGPINDADHNEGTTELAAPEPVGTGGSITEYDLAGKVTKSITTPEGFTADRVIKLNDSYYAADRIEGTEVFYLENNTLKSIYTVRDIVGVVNIGEKLYIQADNLINVFLPGKQGEFGIKSVHTPDDDQALNGIYAGPGYLIFASTIPGLDVANVYKLDD